MILDTTFIIDLMEKEDGAVKKLHELIKLGEPQLTTTLTIFELFSGMTRSNRPLEEKNKVLEVLKGQLVVELNNEAAEKAGEIDGTLIKEGKMIGPIDSMIAGIALVKREKVLTRNIKEFSRIRDLQIETY